MLKLHFFVEKLKNHPTKDEFWVYKKSFAPRSPIAFAEAGVPSSDFFISPLLTSWLHHWQCPVPVAALNKIKDSAIYW